MCRGCVGMTQAKNTARKTAARTPSPKPAPPARAREDDGRPELDPKKPPTTGRGPAPDHEKGRPKDTGRYGA